MSETAQGQGIVRVDDEKKKLDQSIAADASKATGKILTAEDVNPHPDPLGGMVEVGGQVVGDLFGRISGEMPDTYIRTTDDQKGRGILNLRKRLKAGVEGLLNRKAA